jgi:hypothetical protein
MRIVQVRIVQVRIVRFRTVQYRIVQGRADVGPDGTWQRVRSPLSMDRYSGSSVRHRVR